jgi:secreted trypsin-like serine protease
MKLAFFLVGMIFLPFSFFACSSETGLQMQENTIIGGDSLEDFPAVGALMYQGRIVCTGTLVGEREVLTAGHCIVGRKTAEMKFLVGSDVQSPQAQSFSVLRMEKHPDYWETAKTIFNDLALLTLTETVPIEPISVLSKMDSSWNGTRLLFVGYGVDNGYQISGHGRKRGVWLPISNIKDQSFSAGDAEHNTCNGDSGGPALFQASDDHIQIAGVTSYGTDKHCATPGVYNRVDLDNYQEFLAVNEYKNCQGIPSNGQCRGEKLFWCESGELNQHDCSTEGKICVYDDENNKSRCLPTTSTDSCRGETTEGRCQKGWLYYCADKFKSEDCYAENKICGLAPSGYFECITN